ncbi:hypothetical protein [Thiospirochaeta perfilievii]|nr:hypothetical protein [Thiospirochaeta perfilievii]
MNRITALDKKIVELQKAVQSLKNNRDDLVKELEIVKARTSTTKRTV